MEEMFGIKKQTLPCVYEEERAHEDGGNGGFSGEKRG
jgi:hypothetical protein